jgi:Na+-transporting NADH:ubiquinone oxidoreductase subunit NqrE
MDHNPGVVVKMGVLCFVIGVIVAITGVILFSFARQNNFVSGLCAVVGGIILFIVGIIIIIAAIRNALKTSNTPKTGY